MAVSITIAGVDRTSLIRRDSVRASLAGPNVSGTLDCVLDDPNRQVTISPRQELLVLDGATRLWGGLIVGVRAEVVAGGMRRYRISARDHGVLLDDETTIDQTFAAGTTERAVVQAIVSGSGLSAPDSTVVVTTTLSQALTIKATSRRLAIEQLMDAVGGTRYLWVDELAQVHYRSSSLGAAPFVLVDTAPSTGQADYAALSIDTDATSGPTAATRGQVEVIGADGWKPGQTVTISSTALGLTNAQYLVAEVDLAFETDAVRRWRLGLGAPPKRLSTALASAPSLPPPTIDSIAQFAASIRPPVIVSSLPTLPNGAFPAGSLVYLTTDGKLYKTETGSAWEPVVTAVDLDGQITSTQISDGAISTPKLAANSVVAGKVAAGAIGTNELAAGAITAEKIATNTLHAGNWAGGSVRNLVPNPGFELPLTDGAMTYWVRTGGGSMTRSQETPRSGGWNGRANNNSGSVGWCVSARFPVAGNRRYRIRGWARGNSSQNVANFTVGLAVRWFDSTGAIISDVTVASAAIGTVNAYTEFTNVLTAPANAAAAYIFWTTPSDAGSGVVYLDDVEMYEVDEDTSHAGGDVTIDASGVTITNGKLTFVDNYGATALDGAGFGDAWQDFIRAGLYNGNFSRVSGGEAAGWAITNGTFPLTVVTGTGWGSGNAIQYAPTGTSAANSRMLSDRVSITGRQFIRVSTYWSVIAGTAQIETLLDVLWYDAAGTEIGGISTAWMPVPNNWFVETGVLSPPGAARYVAVRIYFRCVSGSGTVQLRSVAASDWQTTTEFIPPGTIVMWSGSTAPAGWALCDGTNGTPDLRDRFIVAGNLAGGATPAAGQSGGTISPRSAGSAGSHSHGGATGSAGSHGHTVSVSASATTVGSGTGVSNASAYTHTHSGSTDTKPAHTHSVGSDGSHSHAVPTYYVLAFIMKL